MGPQYVLDGGLCFSAFHGEKELLSRRYAQCRDAMVVFDGYQSKSHDSPETNQRARRSYCNLDGEYASHHEKGSVSCKQGKQAAINQHAQYFTTHISS